MLETGIAPRRAKATIEEGLRLLRREGVELVYFYDLVGAAWVRIDPDVAVRLRQHPLIDYIEPRSWGSVTSDRMTPSVSATMISQTTPWGVTLIDAPTAWSTTRGSGVKVEIVDTGHDRGHEDLPLLPLGNCGNDSFGSGCEDGAPTWHGTFSMGIVAARDNSLGTVGVANGIEGSNLFSYRACNPSTGGCSSTIVGRAINEGVDNWKVQIMNFGVQFTVDDGFLANAVASAWNEDVVLIASAGNNAGNTAVYPAAYSIVLGVSGVRQDKSFASTSPCGTSSNHGSHVDLAAPFWTLSTIGNDGYASEVQGYCGTSTSTAFVTGVAALVRSMNPGYNNLQVVNVLQSTAEDLGSSGRDDFYGHGLVDAAAAVGVVNNAEAAGHLLPSNMGEDEIRSVYVKMKNTGATTWSPSNYSLDLHRDGVWFPFSVSPSSFVAPGNEHTFWFDLQAQTTGTHACFYRMASTGGLGGFFGEENGRTIEVTSGGGGGGGIGFASSPLWSASASPTTATSMDAGPFAGRSAGEARPLNLDRETLESGDTAVLRYTFDHDQARPLNLVLRFQFDPEVLEFEQLRPGRGAANLAKAQGKAERGDHWVRLVGEVPRGSGEIATFPFRLRPGATLPDDLGTVTLYYR